MRFHGDSGPIKHLRVVPITTGNDQGVAQNWAQSPGPLSCLDPRRPIAETPFLAAGLFLFLIFFAIRARGPLARWKIHAGGV
jgi:hypothetical protein